MRPKVGAMGPYGERMGNMTAGTAALIQLVNVELANNGTEFVPAVESNMGPLGTSVTGSIKGHPVRLDFGINPANDRRGVNLYDLRTRQGLAERLAVSTFEESISGYPWAVTIAALFLV